MVEGRDFQARRRGLLPVVAGGDGDSSEVGPQEYFTRLAHEFGRRVAQNASGGTDHGMCEVDNEKHCAWTLIYRKMEKIGRLDYLEKIQPPKNYQVMTKPGKYTHEAFQQAREES